MENTKTTETPAQADGKPAVPTTVNLSELKLREVVAAKPNYSDLLGVGMAKLANWAKETATTATKLKETAKDFRGMAKGIGVMYAAFQSLYSKAQETGVLDKGTSFKDYVKATTGSPPEPHAQSCGQCFSRLVLSSQLLTEEQYHTCATDWLEKANAVIGHCLAQGADLRTDATVKAVADILTLKTATVDTAAKLLRELRGKQTGKVQAEGGEVTAEKAVELVDAIAAAGHLAVLLAHLPDALKTRPAEERAGLFSGYYRAGGLETRLEESFGTPEEIEAWHAEAKARLAAQKAAAAGPKLVTSAPAETPATAPAELVAA